VSAEHDRWRASRFLRLLIIPLLSGATAHAQVSLDGTTTFGTVTVPLEIEFSDAVSDLEAIFTLHYEGAKGHWGIIADYSFLNLGPSAELPTGSAVNVDFENTVFEIAGMYRFGAASPWQLLAGWRRYEIDLEADGLPAPPLPATALERTEEIDDLFFGGRYIREISDRWTFIGRGDVGAGDSGDPPLSWTKATPVMPWY